MKKEEFQETFRALIDGLVDEFPVTNRLIKFAEKFKVSMPTIQRWYEGISAPHEFGREVIINQLYAEQKKREIANIVREIIKKDLKLEVTEPSGYYNSGGYTIYLKLGDEIIGTVYFDVPGCKCNDY